MAFTTDHAPVVLGVALLLLLFIARLVVLSVVEERKIRALGGRAPKIRSWVPFGLDFIAVSLLRSRKHELLNFWQGFLADFGNPERPFTVEHRIVGQRLVLTADEENIKALLATQFNDFGKGDEFHAQWHDFLGDSIFTTDGNMWHSSRQLIRPQFIKDRVSDLDVFEKHVNILLPLLSPGSSGQPVDVVDLFFKFTLDSATDFLLGHSVQSLERSSSRYSEAFATVQHVQGVIARAGPLYWLVNRKSFFEGLKIMDDFIQPFIDEALHLSPEERESGKGYTFLHALADFTRDPKVLRDQLTAVMLAGRDTTAMTLSWMFYELSRRPEIVTKLRQEIADIVSMDSPPTYAHLKSMKYLQHTINETMRMYPIVPYNVRIALKDTTLPHGGGVDGMESIGVLAGTPVTYSTLALQRRQDIYPPASEKFAHHAVFSPERWDSWTPKTWTYIPFNGGPRICIGQQFALTEVGYTAVRILQRYSRIENMMDRVPGLKADIVLQPSDGVNVAFFQ